MSMKRRVFQKQFWPIASVFCAVTSCQKAGKEDPGKPIGQVEASDSVMGTLGRVVVWGWDRNETAKAANNALMAMDDFGAVVTDYHPKSPLNEFCQKEALQPHRLGPVLFRALQEALTLAEQTDGLCDPTLGALTHLWRRAKRKNLEPTKGEVQAALKSCGRRLLVLDEEQQTGTRLQTGLQLDLGAFAKGQGVDLAAEFLEKQGYRIYLISLGGEVRLGDPPPKDEGWKVAVAPNGMDRASYRILANCAVSTSGSLYQSKPIQGKKRSHLLDPRTGYPVELRQAATVIAPTATLADPLATATALTGQLPPIFRNRPEITAIVPTAAEKEDLF